MNLFYNPCEIDLKARDFLKKVTERATLYEQQVKAEPEKIKMYISDAAVLVSLGAAHFESENFDQVKEFIGKLLRIISHELRLEGFVLPIVGLIEAATMNGDNEKGKQIAETIRRWAADQNWHRGDFVIVYGTIEEAKRTFIQNYFEQDSSDGKEFKISPVDNKRHAERIWSEAEMTDNAEERQFLEAIADGVKMGNGDAIERWWQNFLGKLQNEVGGESIERNS